MENAKHTPGPWKWERRADDAGKLIALLLVTEHRPVPCNDPVIFAVREDWMGHIAPEREAAKNLIAAAPDMLAALCEIAGYPHADHAGLTIERARSVARAAIAKAEGRNG